MFSFFRRKKDLQTFPSKKLQKVINNAIKFLNKSPTHPLPLKERFSGCGVYILYYNGSFYNDLVGYSCESYFITHPIYVGKAVPTGWRNGRSARKELSYNLWKRIQEHSKNIDQVFNLNAKDFQCKYIILDSDLITTVEARLIRDYKPIWNCIIDGFGNHHPGKTRFDQVKPNWDVLHPGRPWSFEMSENENENMLIDKIKKSL